MTWFGEPVTVNDLAWMALIVVIAGAMIYAGVRDYLRDRRERRRDAANRAFAAAGGWSPRDGGEVFRADCSCGSHILSTEPKRPQQWLDHHLATHTPTSFHRSV